MEPHALTVPELDAAWGTEALARSLVENDDIRWTVEVGGLMHFESKDSGELSAPLYVSGLVYVAESESSGPGGRLRTIRRTLATPHTKLPPDIARDDVAPDGQYWIKPVSKFQISPFNDARILSLDADQKAALIGITHSEPAEDEKELSQRERQVLLRIIGILTKLLHSTSSDYSFGDGRLNRNSISTAIETFAEELGERDGLSSRNLNDKLAEALALLPERDR